MSALKNFLDWDMKMRRFKRIEEQRLEKTRPIRLWRPFNVFYTIFELEMRERIKRRAKFLPDPQERMTGLADVTKRSIPRFKEVSPNPKKVGLQKKDHLRIVYVLQSCIS